MDQTPRQWVLDKKLGAGDLLPAPTLFCNGHSRTGMGARSSSNGFEQCVVLVGNDLGIYQLIQALECSHAA